MSEAVNLSPREIVSELDRHIVGQGDAKRAVAIALRNRWRRQRLRSAMATARFASFWPMMKRSSSLTISRGERFTISGAVTSLINPPPPDPASPE